MATKNTTEWNRQDRDLLIEVKTKLDNVVLEIASMRDNTLSRLAIVEQGKLDRTEANRLQSESMAVHNDHEIRIRFIERWVWGAIALMAAAEVVINFWSNIH